MAHNRTFPNCLALFKENIFKSLTLYHDATGGDGEGEGEGDGDADGDGDGGDGDEEVVDARRSRVSGSCFKCEQEWRRYQDTSCSTPTLISQRPQGGKKSDTNA